MYGDWLLSPKGGMKCYFPIQNININDFLYAFAYSEVFYFISKPLFSRFQNTLRNPNRPNDKPIKISGSPLY